MYGHRVSKDHPRIVANGAIDELNALLGVARWHARNDDALVVDQRLSLRQSQLILIMGLIATREEDLTRYQQDGFQKLDASVITDLTNEAQSIESALNARFRDWVIPGSTASLAGAHLDHARTVCRRAERSVIAIPAEEDSLSRAILYLNRLSDYLWILARALERELAPELLTAIPSDSPLPRAGG